MKRGFWIWNIPNCEGGDPLKIAAAALRAGLTDAFVKVADGPVRFGIYNGKDVVHAVVQALKGVGVRVWGWQYIYGRNPAGEEKIATTRIKELDLDGFVVNAEKEFKQPGFGFRAEAYLRALRSNNPGVEIAFTSYRFPHYHPEFPWNVFFRYCQVNMPQVYWEQATNAGAQARTSIERFRAMAPTMPIYPIGAAYKTGGWRPTPAQIKDFESACESLKVPLVSYWSWEHARRDLPELWPVDVIAPQPLPPDARIARLKSKIFDFEKLLVELNHALSDLKAILK